MILQSTAKIMYNCYKKVVERHLTDTSILQTVLLIPAELVTYANAVWARRVSGKGTRDKERLRSTPSAK